MGPVVSEMQFNKIQALIQKGIDEAPRWSPAVSAAPKGSTAAIMCALPCSPM